MQFSPLAIKRHYILGNLTDKCEPIDRIPVYMDEVSETPIGYADESMGRYADAFLFHLPEDVCKRLATNGYNLDIDYDVQQQDVNGAKTERLKLNHILLTSRVGVSTIPRRHPYLKPIEEKSL